MKVKLLVDNVRLPHDPKAKRGVVKKGTVVEVDKGLARRLVYSARAEWYNPKDKPKGPMKAPGEK